MSNIEVNGKVYMPMIDVDSIEMEVEIDTVASIVAILSPSTRFQILNELARSKDEEVRKMITYWFDEFIGEFDDQDMYIEHVLMNVFQALKGRN